MYTKAEFKIGWKTWIGIILVSLLLWSAIGWVVNLIRNAADNYGVERVVNVYEVHGSDMREPVKCEFDQPLKHLTLIMHWYDTNEEMYADYILLADPVEHTEIWGWSDCAWDEDDSAAWCDIYVVKPDFVHADMNIDTIGHEVLHGACGGFHE